MKQLKIFKRIQIIQVSECKVSLEHKKFETKNNYINNVRVYFVPLGDFHKTPFFVVTVLVLLLKYIPR